MHDHETSRPNRQAAHTPGPWRYGGQVGAARGYILAGLQTPGAPLGIKRVALVAQDLTFAGGDPEANARLIAAAPDLLAACADVLATHDHFAGRGGDERVRIAWSPDQIARLRAAVAKATGEAPHA